MISVSAPGKLFLSGEYAVLEGGRAVVTTVNRRATANIVNYAVPASPVLAAVAKCAGRKLNIDPSKLPNVAVNTDSLSQKRSKLGLGSSAATAASACAVLFEWANHSIHKSKALILKTALEAHTLAQNGRGSGADVSASVMGGTIVFATGCTPKPIDNTIDNLVVIWTGKSASTTSLLGQVANYKAADPLSYKMLMDEMVAESYALANAYRDANINKVIELTKNYYFFMLKLQKASKAPIITPEHALIYKLAIDAGGAAKPSGAGGGDIATAIFNSKKDTENFVKNCLLNNFEPLDIALHTKGIEAS